MKHMVERAIQLLRRRMVTCQRAALKPNSMTDLGWSDERHQAYWEAEYQKARYQLARIQDRWSA